MAKKAKKEKKKGKTPGGDGPTSSVEAAASADAVRLSRSRGLSLSLPHALFLSCSPPPQLFPSVRPLTRRSLLLASTPSWTPPPAKRRPFARSKGRKSVSPISPFRFNCRSLHLPAAQEGQRDTRPLRRDTTDVLPEEIPALLATHKELHKRGRVIAGVDTSVLIHKVR
jgi:hypothetical protein